MIHVVRVAPEDDNHHVRLSLVMPDGTVRHLSPAGFHMIEILCLVASRIGHDLTITSALDGHHSGPEDPHLHGNALDVRTNDLPDPKHTVTMTQSYLGNEKFYAFLEDEDTPNQHMHCQLRHGIIYP